MKFYISGVSMSFRSLPWSICKLLLPCTRLEKLGLREQESRVSVTHHIKMSIRNKNLDTEKPDRKEGNKTSFTVAIASTTSFVKVLPTPEVPMSTVGLIA